MQAQAALTEGLRSEEALRNRAGALTDAASHKLLEVHLSITACRAVTSICEMPRSPALHNTCHQSSATNQLLMYAQAGMDDADAAAKVQAAAPALAAWLEAYIRQVPQATASTAGPGFDGPASRAMCIQVCRTIASSKQQLVPASVRMQTACVGTGINIRHINITPIRDAGKWTSLDLLFGMQEVVDIEESVWAPRLGLKGNVDASLRVGMSVQPQQAAMQNWLQGGTAGQQWQGPAVQQALAPFEFKTGRAHHSHRAQVCGIANSETRLCPLSLFVVL